MAVLVRLDRLHSALAVVPLVESRSLELDFVAAAPLVVSASDLAGEFFDRYGASALVRHVPDEGDARLQVAVELLQGAIRAHLIVVRRATFAGQLVELGPVPVVEVK